MEIDNVLVTLAGLRRKVSEHKEDWNENGISVWWSPRAVGCAI